VSDMTQIDEFPFPRDEGCPLWPSKEYARRRHEEPVSRVRTGTDNDPWLITRYADAIAVLGNPAAFSQDPLAPGYPHRPGHSEILTSGFLMEIDPPLHTRLRGVVNEEFSVRRIGGHAELVRRVVSQVLDDFLASGSPADLVSGIAYRLPGLVICELLGVPYEDKDLFLNWITLCFGPPNEESQKQAAVAAKEFADYVDELLTQKQRSPSDDIIGRMVKNSLEPGTVSRDELLTLIRSLVVGGFDTTANTISLGTLAFLLHPEQMAALRDNSELAGNAAEEVLRVTAITHLGRRRAARKDVEVGGTLIRAGEGVIVSQDAVNRDESLFDDPDRFNIERTGARRHMSFGFGIHLCVGSPLARLELKELFAQMFVRIPTLSLAGTRNDVGYKADGNIWGLQRLEVRW
jgi:cytochrome P450